MGATGRFVWANRSQSVTVRPVRALVSLVGAGPGDPSLLTLAAVRALERADVVLFDALVHPAALAYVRASAERVFVGKRGGHEGITQDEINALLLRYAREGKHVCRLKGGDPFLFGRGSEEAEFLASEGISFEVVPGVSSFLGATAYAGISLTHRTLASSLAVITGTEHAHKATTAHDWSKLATATQTIVLFMGVRKLREETDRLIEHGRAPETPVAVIQWGTRAEQRVVTGTLRDIGARTDDAGITPPALVVIGEVVHLRDTLRWWDKQPLFGCRVLVTRPVHQARALHDELLERGAEPVAFPAIEIVPPTSLAPLEAAARALASYDLVVFTSANGVEQFFGELARSHLDARAFGASKVIAIGPGTAASLQSRGVVADAVPDEFIGEAVAQTALATLGSAAGKRVLVPRAEVARGVLPDALRAAGALVDVVAAYRVVPATGRDIDAFRAALVAGRIDAATFTSGSTVDHVCDALGDDAAALLAPVAVASIGPITSQTATRRGLTVTVEARVHSIPGLLDALEAHYARAGRPSDRPGPPTP